MAFCLWSLWLFNNLYMVIILLNFLISIVSKAHDEAIEIQEQTIYQQKCELNYEYDAIKKFFKFGTEEDEQDMFVIAASFRDDNEDQERFVEEMNAIDKLKN